MDDIINNLKSRILFMSNFAEIREKFEKSGQGHVFKYWGELSDRQKSQLLAQLEEVDLDEIAYLNETLLFANKTESQVDFSKLAPAPYIKYSENKESDPVWQKAKSVGEDAIRAGKLAAFVVAGGQGTRLGYDAPKGTLPISPVKHKPFFQIFAEKIRFAQGKYGVEIPFMVMTSIINHAQICSFFKSNGYFGLNPENVIFFKQGFIPSVDKSGKIILSGKDEIALAPNGHGGCLRAMVRSGAIARLKELGVEYISYFQVDNPLVNIIDPYFLGFHILGGSEMSSKMIPKAYPLEKVGHFCIYNGKLCVIEYSDLPASYQEQLDENGALKFIAGSVAIHILNVDFVEAKGSDDSDCKLPFHVAFKKVSFVDGNGDIVKPEKPNGYKYEMFVFDALENAKNPVVLEGLRREEFSAVKNKDGLDSPAACKRDQKRQFADWLEAAGVPLERDSDGTPVFDIEISPLFASNKSDFVEKWKAIDKKPEIRDGLFIE